MTLLEERKRPNGNVYLHASVTMMRLAVAAIGGGTNLEPQKSIIHSMIGSCDDTPGAKGKLIYGGSPTSFSGGARFKSCFEKVVLKQRAPPVSCLF